MSRRRRLRPSAGRAPGDEIVDTDVEVARHMKAPSPFDMPETTSQLGSYTVSIGDLPEAARIDMEKCAACVKSKANQHGVTLLMALAPVAHQERCGGGGGTARWTRHNHRAKHCRARKREPQELNQSAFKRKRERWRAFGDKVGLGSSPCVQNHQVPSERARVLSQQRFECGLPSQSDGLMPAPLSADPNGKGKTGFWAKACDLDHAHFAPAAECSGRTRLKGAACAASKVADPLRQEGQQLSMFCTGSLRLGRGHAGRAHIRP